VLFAAALGALVGGLLYRCQAVRSGAA
jgi:hypothetical protein